MKKDDCEKAERFREAANRRIRNVETTLRRVGSLSNPASYSYTEEEVDRIFDHLQSVLDHTRQSFAQTRGQDRFNL